MAMLNNQRVILPKLSQLSSSWNPPFLRRQGSELTAMLETISGQGTRVFRARRGVSTRHCHREHHGPYIYIYTYIYTYIYIYIHIYTYIYISLQQTHNSLAPNHRSPEPAKRASKSHREWFGIVWSPRLVFYEENCDFMEVDGIW